jgi:16S rRNA (adenine1518-N6/adenine1519-N6)-dimethyltransferase
LIENSGEVLAIEKDARLVEVLSSRFSPPHFRLIHDDALEFLKREPQDWSAWKLVANLPYSVASPILVELAQSPSPPERMVVTLQLEVAKRLMAQCGDPDYGILTLLVQLHFEPRSFHKIPASCFFPEPDVDSAFVSLIRRKSPLLEPSLSPTFSKLVKLAFSQRRKMMLKLLKTNWPVDRVESAFTHLGISPQARAETISLDRFAQLTRALSR